MWFDCQIGARDSRRKVLLFMDNASVHIFSVEQFELKHTKVMFFPRNTTRGATTGRRRRRRVLKEN